MPARPPPASIVYGVPVSEPTTGWRSLAADDFPALIALSRRVLDADGGLPLAAGEAFLRRRYLTDGARSTGTFAGADLIAAAAVRPLGADLVAATGTVDPRHRGRGLGAHLVDWAIRAAGERRLRIETESATDAAESLFAGRGFHRTFAEDVMRLDVASGPPQQPRLPVGISLTEWSPDVAQRFHAVYQAAFRDRPGYPGWSAAQWIDWISDDDDFSPEWTLLATADGTDLGFVACARGAWIVQLGVVPAARGRGLGAALTVEALRRMHEAGEGEALLDVNVDNPGAARVYERLGFRQIGRRARYEPSV